MSKINNNILIKEAEKQSKLINNLKKWFNNSMGFSTISMVISYFSIKSYGLMSFPSVMSVIMTTLFILISLILNLGIRNGRRNVEKILQAAK